MLVKLKHSLFVILIFFLVCLSVLVNWRIYDSGKFESNQYIIDVNTAVRTRMESLFLEINNFPGSAGQDVLFLSRLDNIINLANSILNKNNFTEHKIRAEKDLSAFIEQNKVYLDLEFIDLEGRRIVWSGCIQKDCGSFADVLNWENNENFIETLKLNSGGVRISKLLYEKSASGIGKTVLYYTTPVFVNNKVSGIILARVNADYFLNDVWNFSRPGENVILTDRNGYYLAGSSTYNDLSSGATTLGNLKNDYPQAAAVILNDGNARDYSDNDYLFNYRFIHPTISSFELHQGMTSDDYWILVDIAKKSDLYQGVKTIKINQFYYIALFNSLVLFILAMIFYLKKQGGFEVR